MSFWNGLKRLFGFGGETEDDDNIEEFDPTPPVYAAPQPVATQTSAVAVRKPDEADAQPSEKCAGDPTLPGDLFDAVIEVFNAAQPDFIKKCLSVEAQREYLLESLSTSLRTRLTNATGATSVNDADSAAENERLKKRVAALEAENKTVESLTQDNRKLRLSLERQKRALLDRINDLETQVGKITTERDKLLIDRRPAAAVQDNARVAELEAEISRLKDEATAAKTELDETRTKLNEALESKTAEPERAESTQAEAPAEDEAAAELKARVATLEKELERQTTMREQAELKGRLADKMMKDMNREVAASRKEVEENRAEATQAMEQIHEQLSKFEGLKARLEARIAELQSALDEERAADRQTQIERLTRENATLRQTIETNLYNQANSEMRLRREIKQLKQQMADGAMIDAAFAADAPSAPMPMAPIDADTTAEARAAQPVKKKRGRPRKTKIDPELNNTDWFQAAEPAPAIQPTAKRDDPDFGYHEPPRTSANDSEAQLTLF